jgi:hypothetical protein
MSSENLLVSTDRLADGANGFTALATDASAAMLQVEQAIGAATDAAGTPGAQQALQSFLAAVHAAHAGHLADLAAVVDSVRSAGVTYVGVETALSQAATA